MFNPKLQILNSTPYSITLEAVGFMGTSHMTLPMNEEKFRTCYTNWQAGKLIQQAFPMLNATQREFLMTGISSDKQWDKITKE
jgi:hypothetical protein